MCYIYIYIIYNSCHNLLFCKLATIMTEVRINQPNTILHYTIYYCVNSPLSTIMIEVQINQPNTTLHYREQMSHMNTIRTCTNKLSLGSVSTNIIYNKGHTYHTCKHTHTYQSVQRPCFELC